MPDPADYWSVDQDPYIDKETGILRNIPGFDSEEELENQDELITALFEKITTKI